MFCMNCGLELPEDAKFCRKCAKPLTSCPECGEELPKRAKFCWKCGKSLTTVSLSSGLKEPEEPGSLLENSENEPEEKLPQRSDNASIFARMNNSNPAEKAAQNGAPSPFKPSAAAKREAKTSEYSPAVPPSPFRPASAKKKEEAPAPVNKAPDVASPFKPISAAKTETQPTRPAAAPRGAAPVGGTRPAAAFRPAAQAQAKTEEELPEVRLLLAVQGPQHREALPPLKVQDPLLPEAQLP